MKKKVLIVIANYYAHISTSLSTDAQITLDFAKIKYSVKEVLGVFEIPVVIAKNIKKYDGFIALGCVIKGETPHFDYISTETSRAIMKMIVQHNIPIGFGVLTTNNMKEAINRSKSDGSNKGREAMEAALDMYKIYTEI